MPSIISNISSLKVIYLGANKLYGTIPPTLFKCKQLQYLSLANNDFIGSVPLEIGDLTVLTDLYLNNNIWRYVLYSFSF